jgi:hypothetical protein
VQPDRSEVDAIVAGPVIRREKICQRRQNPPLTYADHRGPPILIA